MDKKNVMLLTVIAVATLLVAVVGATFAFFSINNTASGTTTATTTTSKMGSVIVDNPTNAMSIKLSAFDMDEKNPDTYYAVTDGSNRSTDETKYPVARVNITNVDLGTKFTCTGTIGVRTTLTGDAFTGENAASKLTDAKNALSGKIKFTAVELPEGSTDTITITTAEPVDLKASADDEVLASYSVTLTDPKTNFNLVNATVSFDNTANNQNALVGATITTSITNKSLVCNVVNNTVNNEG